MTPETILKYLFSSKYESYQKRCLSYSRYITADGHDNLCINRKYQD